MAAGSTSWSGSPSRRFRTGALAGRDCLLAGVHYAQGKRTFLNELREAFDKSPDLKLRPRQRIEQALGPVIGRAQRAGVVRTDVDGADLMQLVAPMCTSATLSEDQGDRLLAMILDGLRVPS
ncbi:MAG: hypothetical protein ACRDZX_16195 [Acidimicrobiales bacterium]